MIQRVILFPFLVLAPLAFGVEVITPPNPTPDVIEARKLYANLRSYWELGPYPRSLFVYGRRVAVADDEGLATQHLAFTSSTDPLHRSRVVGELARCGTRKAVPVLLAQLGRETDRKVVRDILCALTRLSAQAALPELAAYLLAESWQLRLAALRYAAQSGALTSAQVQALTVDENVHVRAEAWGVLAAHDVSAHTWEAALQDPALQIVRLGLRGLMLQPHAEQAHLVRDLATSSRISVRGAVAAALSRHSPEHVALLQGLAGDRSMAIRALAAEACGRLQSPRLQPTLTALAEDPAVEVRMAAVRALAVFHTAESREALFARTADRSERVQDAACDALVQHPSEAVDVQVGPFLEDARHSVRFRCFELVAAIQSQRYGETLAARMPLEEDPMNLGALIDAIAVAGHRPAEEAIVAVAGQSPHIPRAAAFRAISSMRLASGKEAARQAAAELELDPVVRLAAIESLGWVPDAAHAPVLLKLLKQTNPEGTTRPAQRAMAAWAASRLPELPGKLVQRMEAQVRKPVIKTPEGPLHDTNQVRVSCVWALVEHAKRGDRSAAKFAETSIACLRTPYETQAAVLLSLDQSMNAFGYQAQQYWDDAGLTLEYIPLAYYSFSLKRLKTRSKKP